MRFVSSAGQEGTVKNQKNTDIAWARKAAARYGDPDALRGEFEEQAKYAETEKTRPFVTLDLWKELLRCLKAKVRAFNVEIGEEFVTYTRSRDKFSVALPLSGPMPPFNAPAEAVTLSLKYDRRRLLFHLAHSDESQSSVWALRPDIGGGRGSLDLCIVIGKRQVIPYMNMTIDEAAESLVECLLRIAPTSRRRRACSRPSFPLNRP
jgi:hypothetical protein